MKSHPCPICESTRYRKSKQGFYVCEFGHILEGYVEEEQDLDNVASMIKASGRRSTATSKKSTSSSKKKELPVDSEEDEYWVEGDRDEAYAGIGKRKIGGSQARFYEFEAFQYILRQQVHALINTVGLLDELDHIVHDLWLLYADSFNLADPTTYKEPAETVYPSDDQNINLSVAQDLMQFESEVADDQDNLNLTESSAHKKGSRKRKRAPTLGSNTELFPPSILSEADDSSAYSSSDNTSEPSPESDEESSDNHRKSSMRKGYKLCNPENPYKLHYSVKRVQKLYLSHTLALVFLGCVIARVPVMVIDIHTWANNNVIPYLNALEILPPKLRYNVSRRGRFLYQNNIIPHPRSVIKDINTFSRMFEAKFYITIPPANTPLILYRFIYNLLLPAEMYTFVNELLTIIKPELYYQCSGSSAPEIQILGCILIAFKFIWGLGNKDPPPSSPETFSSLFPQITTWYEQITKLQTKYNWDRIPFSPYDLPIYSEKELDWYIRWLESEVPLFKSGQKFADLQDTLGDMVSTLSSDQWLSETPSSSVHPPKAFTASSLLSPFRRHILDPSPPEISDRQPRSEPQTQFDKPSEHKFPPYIQYGVHHLHTSGRFHLWFDRVIKTFSSVVGIEDSIFANVVTRLEARLDKEEGEMAHENLRQGEVNEDEGESEVEGEEGYQQNCDIEADRDKARQEWKSWFREIWYGDSSHHDFDSDSEGDGNNIFDASSSLKEDLMEEAEYGEDSEAAVDLAGNESEAVMLETDNEGTVSL
ncbi:hypothetical protein BKA69DRAFT_1173806 [Paraphysoderma sedebokerense]|nr:hypothetical protein BKA69DRAFT_1173806 [Paraphysoderma sedebokerense]